MITVACHYTIIHPSYNGWFYFNTSSFYPQLCHVIGHVVENVRHVIVKDRREIVKGT